ncbi:MAG: 2-hydroxyglutaryl-CoA dehydratase [Acutalibacteraceae bacterium]
MQNKYYVEFTEEMRKNYTILAPNMLPMHFKLIIKVMSRYGYNVELLETSGKHIAETGLKYVHNDTCYPAILVIGQFLDALQSGKYDPHKVALIMFQTGGGCRASNYISLIRKALEKAGFGYVPVISMSLKGIESHSGWKLTVPMLHRMLYGVLYADMLMSLVNQCRPYELEKGSTEALADLWVTRLVDEMAVHRVSYKAVKQNYLKILKSFENIPMNRTKRPKVGVVGEIFVKYSPLGNNSLNEFLEREGAEVVVPGFLDFCLYSVMDGLRDYELYHIGSAVSYRIYKLAYKFLLKKQKDMIDIMQTHGVFLTPTAFDHTMSLVDGYISTGAKMGEGWLLTAEMLELSDKGVKNIVCTQPFGCLPNHICGKGMMKPIKENNKDINIVAIDYDAGASGVNQENRIKLMLAGQTD